MANPKILKALNDLDKSGYLNQSDFLGDYREDASILDAVLNNGIYSFIGGEEEIAATEGSFDWILRVYADSDNSSVEQKIKNISSENGAEFVRIYNDGVWSEWEVDGGEPEGGTGTVAIIYGEGAPTEATVGNVGDEYINTSITPNGFYKCLGATDGVYTWRRIGYMATKLITEIITSSTTWTVPNDLEKLKPVRILCFGTFFILGKNDSVFFFKFYI